MSSVQDLMRLVADKPYGNDLIETLRMGADYIDSLEKVLKSADKIVKSPSVSKINTEMYCTLKVLVEHFENEDENVRCMDNILLHKANKVLARSEASK